MLDRYDHDLLLDYLEGELDAPRRAQLEAALKDDAELAALLEAMAGDRDLLRSLPRERVPSELSQDLTQALERRMLLDESLGEAGPIPIARGRGLPTEPARGSGWRRVAALTGLAASVAIAAGVVVFYLPDDPLEHTANRLADAPDAPASDKDPATARQNTPGTDRDSTPPDTDTPANALARRGTTNNDTEPQAGALPPDPAQTPPAQPDTDRLARTDDGTARAARTPEPAADAASPDALGLDHFAWRSAPTPTAGIASLRPQSQLVLFTEQPELSREQLVMYCISNGIPIVQADDTAHAAQPDADNPADRNDNFGAETQAAPERNYALLINGRQLNDLVVRFNNDVLIDTQQAGQRPAIASQAAVLQRLDAAHAPDRLADHDPKQDPGQLPGFDLNKALSNTVAYEDPRPDPQQAIQLYLPEDLGSAYANTLNRNNFTNEQRRNTYSSRNADSNDDKLAEEAESIPQSEPWTELGIAAAEEAESPDAADTAQPEPKQAPAQPEALREKQAPADAEDQASKDDKPANEDVPAADQPEQPETRETNARVAEQPQRPASRLDPSRSNWLAPHLPMSETTLILNWRLDTPSEPSQLVPIQIKAAPADEIRSQRRQQQQIEAEHKRKPEPEPEPESDAGSDAATEKAAEAEAPAEAEPDSADE